MNTRVVVVGIAMVVLALAFFIGMATVASKSTDPVGLMQTVGTGSGAVGALGIVLERLESGTAGACARDCSKAIHF